MSWAVCLVSSLHGQGALRKVSAWPVSACFRGLQRKRPERKPCTRRELPQMEGSKQSCASAPPQHSPPRVAALTSKPRKKSITCLASLPTCISHTAGPPHGRPARAAEHQPGHPCPAPHLPSSMFPQARGTAGQLSCYLKGWLPGRQSVRNRLGRKQVRVCRGQAGACWDAQLHGQDVKPPDGMPGPMAGLMALQWGALCPSGGHCPERAAAETGCWAGDRKCLSSWKSVCTKKPQPFQRS